MNSERIADDRRVANRDKCRLLSLSFGQIVRANSSGDLRSCQLATIDRSEWLARLTPIIPRQLFFRGRREACPEPPPYSLPPPRSFKQSANDIVCPIMLGSTVPVGCCDCRFAGRFSRLSNEAPCPEESIVYAM